MAGRDDYYHGRDHILEYKKHRPSYPDSIFKYITDYTKAKLPVGEDGLLPLAVDVGCGTGEKSTYPLLPYFRNILGCDSSAVAIQAAQQSCPDPRIHFRQCLDDKLQVEDNSTNLVLVATALHWFDPQKLYSEVDRVLVPGGVVACMCYHWFKEVVGHPKSAEIVETMNEFIRRPLSRGFSGEKGQVLLVYNLYREASVQIPYSDKLRCDDFVTETALTLDDFLQIPQTFSIFKDMTSAEPELTEQWWNDWKDRLVRAMGADCERSQFTLRQSIVLLMGRKPSSQ